MKRYIIIDPVIIEVFDPANLTTRLERNPGNENLKRQEMAPGIYLLTVNSNFFTEKRNTKIVKQ